MTQKIQALPILALRDIIFFPNVTTQLFIGREVSIKAINFIDEDERTIILLSQNDPLVDEPSFEDLFPIGVLAKVLKILELPDSTYKILVETQKRVKVETVLDQKDFLMTDHYSSYNRNPISSKDLEKSLSNSIVAKFEEYIKFNKKSSHQDLLEALNNQHNLSDLIDLIASHFDFSIQEKQQLLSEKDCITCSKDLLVMLQNKIELLKVEKKIHYRVKEQIDQNQKEYYLNEQIKAIQKELGDENLDELDELRKTAEKLGLNAEAKEKIKEELKKLGSISPQSTEYSITRTYIDTILSLPWKKKSRLNHDLEKAQKILNDTHYGLDKIKERIIEHLAVCKRNPKAQASILCLIGPPGVGKTSLARSIAKATDRKFVRMSLGGVRDESEIRGHRRTYIASMPGGLIKNIIKAGKSNPLFLIDEIDKMGMDYRGDPASALLEVFDPEQNKNFKDHYLDLGYDLSEVMFITTANSYNIPAPLLDRMEVIDLTGYTEEEKIHIAKEHLLPDLYQLHLLAKEELSINHSALLKIIQEYTRESGVRNLRKQLDKIARKIVLQLDRQEIKKSSISLKNLYDYLGNPRFSKNYEMKDRIGQVMGLAWTEQGGDILFIESAMIDGKGKLNYTGHLGDIMQESIQTAMTVVKSNLSQFNVDSAYLLKKDIHIHVPDGATPKDGPSAGVGMCIVILSVLIQQKIRSDTALTGEITLRGEVTKIGGLKEKLLAAHRYGIKNVLIPKDNAMDLKEMPNFLLNSIKIKPITNINEAFLYFFGTQFKTQVNSNSKKKKLHSIKILH